MKLETSVVALFLLTAGLFCCDAVKVPRNGDLRRRMKGKLSTHETVNARTRSNLRRGLQISSESVSDSESV